MWKKTSIGRIAAISLASILLVGLGCGRKIADDSISAKEADYELRSQIAEPEEVNVEIMLKDQRKASPVAVKDHAPSQNINPSFANMPGHMSGQMPGQQMHGQIPGQPTGALAGQLAPNFEPSASLSTNCIGASAGANCAPGLDGAAAGYPGYGGFPGYGGYPGVGVFGLDAIPAGYFIGSEFFLTPPLIFDGSFIEVDDGDRFGTDDDDSDDSDDSDDADDTDDSDDTDDTDNSDDNDNGDTTDDDDI